MEGRCRERSPADRAIFGPDADRFIARFVVPAEGQALLARCTAEGAAEATAQLHAQAGEQLFRISLWRQRGGDRIRILAAFAAEMAEPLDSASEHDPGGRGIPAFAVLSHEMRSPLTAAMGFAELIRSEQDRLSPDQTAAYAGDIVAAAWRLMRLADDLVLVGQMQGHDPPLRLAEVDIARLVRRILRLAEPQAEAVGATLVRHGFPERGTGPLVIADEDALWSAIDNLLQNAIRHAGQDGRVDLVFSPPEPGRGLVIEIADDGPGLSAEALRAARRPLHPGLAGMRPARAGGLGLAIIEEMVAANAARLEIETAEGAGLRARIVFPPARCLSPA